MSIYKWEGKTLDGESKKGELEASNRSIALAMLRKQRIRPTKIKEKKSINCLIENSGKLEIILGGVMKLEELLKTG